MEIRELTIEDMRTLAENCTVEYKLECSICGNSNLEVEVEPLEEPFEALLEAVKEEGWVEMESDQYAQVGYTCPGCVEDEKEWEKEQD